MKKYTILAALLVLTLVSMTGCRRSDRPMEAATVPPTYSTTPSGTAAPTNPQPTQAPATHATENAQPATSATDSALPDQSATNATGGNGSAEGRSRTVPGSR